MPIIVDINVNTERVQRVYICRIDGTSTQEDSVNLYSIVLMEKQPVFFEDRGTILAFPPEPTWLEREEGVRFEHRYGDGATVCVLKGLQAYYDNVEGEQK